MAPRAVDARKRFDRMIAFAGMARSYSSLCTLLSRSKRRFL